MLVAPTMQLLKQLKFRPRKKGCDFVCFYMRRTVVYLLFFSHFRHDNFPETI